MDLPALTALHRLPDGMYLIQTQDVIRAGWIGRGWDENGADWVNSSGTAVV